MKFPPFLGAMYHKVAIYANVQEVMCNGEVIGDLTENLAYLLGRSCVHVHFFSETICTVCSVPECLLEVGIPAMVLTMPATPIYASDSHAGGLDGINPP